MFKKLDLAHKIENETYQVNETRRFMCFIMLVMNLCIHYKYTYIIHNQKGPYFNFRLTTYNYVLTSTQGFVPRGCLFSL